MKYNEDLLRLEEQLDPVFKRINETEIKKGWLKYSIQGAWKLLASKLPGFTKAISAIMGLAIPIMTTYIGGVPWYFSFIVVLLLYVFIFYFFLKAYQNRMLDISSEDFNIYYYKIKRPNEYLIWEPLLKMNFSFKGLRDYVKYLEVKEGSELQELKNINQVLEDSVKLAKNVDVLTAEYENLLKQHEKTKDLLLRTAKILMRHSYKRSLEVSDLGILFSGFVVYHVFDNHLKRIMDNQSKGNYPIVLSIKESDNSGTFNHAVLESLRNQKTVITEDHEIYYINLGSDKWILVLERDIVNSRSSNYNLDFLEELYHSIFSLYHILYTTKSSVER